MVRALKRVPVIGCSLGAILCAGCIYKSIQHVAGSLKVHPGQGDVGGPIAAARTVG
jgi:hypothetical protein